MKFCSRYHGSNVQICVLSFAIFPDVDMQSDLFKVLQMSDASKRKTIFGTCNGNQIHDFGL